MHENVKEKLQIPNSKAHPVAVQHLRQQNCDAICLSHWVLAELDLTTDEVAIYHWLAGMELEEYNKLEGVSL
jgi:hypothetical protein